MIHAPPHSERVSLAKIATHDLDDLVSLDSDPEVMRYLTGGVPTPREDYTKEGGLLSRMMRFSGQSMGYFSARHEGQFIGWFHLRPSVFDPDVPELGYRLAQRAWGQGLATEMSLALCRWAFDDLGHSHVDSCALPANKASIAVMLKCGMRYISSGPHPSATELVVDRYMVSRGDWEGR